MTGAPTAPHATAKVLWDAQNLYIGVDVADDFLKSTFKKHDDHLWEQDAVEVMVDPHGTGHDYFEMQVSPSGAIFDTRYDSRRVPAPVGHVDWDSHMHAKVTACAARSTTTGRTRATPWSCRCPGAPSTPAPRRRCRPTPATPGG